MYLENLTQVQLTMQIVMLLIRFQVLLPPCDFYL